MPIKYAVRTIHPLTSEQEAEKKRLSYSRTVTYEKDVPHIVADMDEENGMYAIFSTNDVRLTDWLQLKESNSFNGSLALGRKQPGLVLKDSLQRDIIQGDYLMTHNYDQTGLELNLVIRNMKVKTETQQLTNIRSWGDSLRKRNPEATLKLPKELIDDEGGAVNEVWEKRFALREQGRDPLKGLIERYHSVNEATASQDETGHLGYFNSNGELVTGWIPFHITQWEENYLNKKVYNRKPVVDALDTPLTDALGADLQVGDWVFSNDNHYNRFMLCEVKGFTEEKVLLLAYDKAHTKTLQGIRIRTWNKSAKIVKLPLTITSV